MVLSQSAGVTCWALGGWAAPHAAQKGAGICSGVCGHIRITVCLKSFQVMYKIPLVQWTCLVEMLWNASEESLTWELFCQKCRGVEGILLDGFSFNSMMLSPAYLSNSARHTQRQTDCSGLGEKLFAFFFFNEIYLVGICACVSVYSCKSEVFKNFDLHKLLKDRFVGVV